MAAKLSARRVGLTLLELVLALSLSIVLLFAIGLSLRLYWRSFDVKRTNVEQAHLARAILRKMEDDLRTAVQYMPVDLSGLQSMTSSSSVSSALAGMAGAGSPAATGGGSGAGGGPGAGAGNGTGGGTGTGGGGAANQASQSGSGGSTPGGSANSSASNTGSAPSTQSGGSSSPMGGATASDPAATGDSTGAATTAETPPAVVGLYGSAYQLQFDVSRLPRVDEYANSSPASMVQIPSDIKTLTYYVRNDSSGGNATISNFGSSSTSTAPAAGSSEPSPTGQGRGLMRLEMDRAVSAYSENNGSPSTGYDSAKLLADEVTSITFRYWNGTEWVSDWNSDEMGGLPLAVEIVMTMADANVAASTTSPAQNFGATTSGSTDPSYRMVVNLPTASLPPPVEEPATTEGTDATAGTTTPGSSSSSATPGSGGFSAPAMGGSGSAGSSSSGSGSSSYGTGSKTGGS